jgi:acyl-CoA reductase-like NAD-dependent aldehyde dehydrogenase
MAKTALKNLVDGQRVAGSGYCSVHNPFDGSEVGRVALATPEQVEQALAAAARDRRAAARIPARLRAALLDYVREHAAKDQEELAQLLCAEAGKPITLARGEIGRGLETLRLSAEEARRLTGEYLPLDLVGGAEGYQGFVRRGPRGPATTLWPYNFPFNLLVHKIGPALAAGCPVLMRPPSATPLTGHRVATYLHEGIKALGLPTGLVAFLASGHAAAAPLIDDPRVAALSFTGSDTVGWELKRRANRKQVMLELGGQASLIVEPDAPDLAFAAKRAALGAFAYAGQVCISVQRLMVNRKIMPKFMELFMNEVEALKTGDPRDPGVMVGPLIDDAADERIGHWIADALHQGAELICGERLAPRLYTPHVLARVKSTTQLHCGEAFGPLVVVEPYKEFADAVELTNASRFGLQSAVFTSDIGKALNAWRDIEVGGLIVNDYPTFRVDHMPYGGVKDSGFGREGVRYAIQEYTEPRLMAVRSEA